MGSADKFCLRWNDFETNISSAFRELRDDSDFFDVTLSCEDGSKQVQAHKLILSACSPFFKTILRRNLHANPLLYLKGVRYQDLVAVLNFMYHGEANVSQEELNSFLAVAEDLSVKGLTTEEQGQTTGNATTTTTLPSAKRPISSTPLASTSKRKKPDNNGTPLSVKAEEEEEVAADPAYVEFPDDSYVGAEAAAGVGGEYEDEDDDDDYVGEDDDDPMPGTSADKDDQEELTGDPLDYVTCVDNVWFCTVCQRRSSSRTNCKRHVSFVHMNKCESAQCPICHKVFRRKHNMVEHARNHRIKNRKMYNKYYIKM